MQGISFHFTKHCIFSESPCKKTNGIFHAHNCINIWGKMLEITKERWSVIRIERLQTPYNSDIRRQVSHFWNLGWGREICLMEVVYEKFNVSNNNKWWCCGLLHVKYTYKHFTPLIWSCSSWNVLHHLSHFSDEDHQCWKPRQFIYNTI